MSNETVAAVYDDLETTVVEETSDDGVQNEGQEGQNAEEGKEEVLEVSPSMQKALDEGWTPKDDWVEAGKDPDAWVDFKEFNYRGDLMKKISTKNKALKDQQEKFEKTLKEQIRISQKQIEAAKRKERDSLLAELKKQRRDAMEMQDFDKLDLIEEEMDKVKEEYKPSAKDEEPEEKPKQVDKYGKTQDFWEDFDKEVQNQFVGKNEWYGKDQELTDYFDYQFIRELNSVVEQNQDFDKDDLHKAIARVDRRIKSTFSNKFNKHKPPAVEGKSSASKSSGKSKFSKSDLNQFQFDIGKGYVEDGVMTWDEYVNGLAEIGELGVK